MQKKIDEKKYTTPTRLIYGKAVSTEWDYSYHVIPPITASSTFRLGSAERGAKGFEAIGAQVAMGFPDPIYVYDRMGEPNNNMLQDALAIAEGAECAVTYATGMAAVHAATTFALGAGSEVISHKIIYGCTYSLFQNWFPRFQIPVHFCDLRQPDAFLPFVNENTRILYLESPANPTLELIDLAAVAQLVREINAKRGPNRQIITVIDNTFATPWCQRPIELGIDVSLHSLTKGISGFGAEMGGAVITRHEFFDALISHRKDFGGTLRPLTAWHILVYGLSTLGIRIEKQQANALAVAKFLEGHPKVERVLYPGLESFPQYELAKKQMRDYSGKFAPGTIIYFVLKGSSPDESKKEGELMMDYIADHAYTVTLAVSLGQLRTLIEHPGSMTHAGYSAEEQVARGMDPGGIRLAIGIEESSDIIQDLSAALDNC